MARSRGTSRKVTKSALDDAAYYQSHKDALGEWGGAEPVLKTSKRMEVVVSVRFRADEERILRRESAKRGQTLSSFIRTAVLAYSRTGAITEAKLMFESPARTQPSAGGQIAFPGGNLVLTARPSAAEPALPSV